MQPMLISKANLPQPGSCARCMSHKRDCLDLGIDFGLETPRAGAILICTECFANLAKIMGYEKPVARKEAPVSDYIKESEERIKRVRDVIHELDSSLTVLSANLSGGDDDTVVSSSTKTAKDGRDSSVGQSNDSSVNKKPAGVSGGSGDEPGDLLAGLL